MFCDPETVDVAQGEAERNIKDRGFLIHTGFLSVQ